MNATVVVVSLSLTILSFQLTRACPKVETAGMRAQMCCGPDDLHDAK